MAPFDSSFPFPMAVALAGAALIQGRSEAAPLTLPAAQGVPLTQDLYLKASNTGIEDRFGAAVAAFGDRIVVGAPGEDSNATGVNGSGSNNSMSLAGAAYVFRFVGGEWVQEAYLKASNTNDGDVFGTSVALGEDVVVVGAPGEDGDGVNQSQNGVSNSGAVYVFRFTEGVGWAQTNYLKASNAEGDDLFGESVAIDGEWLIVGADGEDSSTISDPANNAAVSAGAAYVFREAAANVWVEDAYLKSSDPDDGDEFGCAVDIWEDESGDAFALVGARFEDSSSTGVGGDPFSNGSANSGAAFLFKEDGLGWSSEEYFKASNAGAGDSFGFSVAIDGTQIAIGAPDEDSSVGGINPMNPDNTLTSAGAAYFFSDGFGGWVEDSYVKSSTPGPLDRFGFRVACADGRFLVSAVGEASSARGINGNESSNSAGFSGAAYLFEAIQFVGLGQTAYIKSSNSDPNDSFAAGIALTDRWALSGASREDGAGTGTMASQLSNFGTDSGAAYIFRLGDGPFLSYCFAALNSSGSFGRLSATGSGLITDNDVVLQASSLPANVFGFFIVGNSRSFVMFPGGSLGNICIGGSMIGRYVGPGQTQNSGPGGSISLAIDATAIPFALGPVAAQPGEEYHFQAWFRDSSFGAPASNFTQGLTVLFR